MFTLVKSLILKFSNEVVAASLVGGNFKGDLLVFILPGDLFKRFLDGDFDGDLLEPLFLCCFPNLDFAFFNSLLISPWLINGCPSCCG